MRGGHPSANMIDALRDRDRATQPGDGWNVCRHLNIEIGGIAPVPPAQGQQVRADLQDAVGRRESEAVSTGAPLVHLKAARIHIARNIVAIDEDAHIVVDRHVHDHVRSALWKFKFLSYQDISPLRPRRLDTKRIVQWAPPLLKGAKTSIAQREGRIVEARLFKPDT